MAELGREVSNAINAARDKNEPPLLKQ